MGRSLKERVILIKQHFVKFTICFAALAAVAHAATVDFSNFPTSGGNANPDSRSEEHTSELQSH